MLPSRAEPRRPSETVSAHRRFMSQLADQLDQLEVVDAHTHVGSWRAFSSYLDDHPGLTVKEETALRAEYLDRFGADQVFLLPSVHHSGGLGDVRIANDAVLRQRDASPRVAAGFFGVGLDDINESLTEMERCIDAGLVGLTLHHRFAGKVIDHPIMWPVLEALREAGLPALIHCLAESTLEALWRLERLAADFPEVTFVALGALSSPSSIQWAIHVGRFHPNIWFDTAVLLPVGTMLESFCEEVGADRLIYGSDLYVDPPTYRFPFALFEILASDIGPEDKQAILGGNARRLVGERWTAG